jgi:MinD-like ATPase involved in chromosome partitioning or flagellar assembly
LLSGGVKGSTQREQRPGLEVIAGDHGNARTLDVDDYQRLADLLAARYPLIMIDPAPSGLMRELSVADQLVLVAPASPDAATSLANTQQWLGAHGHGDLAARAVTVVNGVSKRTMENVLRAESVARGRCRAIVRVPWDDLLLSARPSAPSSLHPQTRLAYTALAGVLVAGLAAAPITPVPGRNAGEHSD